MISAAFGRRLVVMLALTFAAVAYFSYGRLVFTGRGHDMGTGVLLGGDYVVFHEAAHATSAARVDSLYRFDDFTASLRARYPGHGTMKFGWQYPPTMLLLVRPWHRFDFRAGFYWWTVAGLVAFGAVVWRRVTDPLTRVLVATSPTVLLAIITGQTGLFTGALVGVALWAPERNPVAAGIAAGLLTVKPQLGLLIPVAYIAARCWRAIAVAATTAVLLGLASLANTGPAAWRASLAAVQGIAGKMSGAEFPAERFTTPFGLLQAVGVPIPLATFGQLVATVLLVAWVAWAWAPVKGALRDVEWRFAAVAAAIPLATPYAMYYELPMVLLALAVLGERAGRTGWLPGERWVLAALWALPFLPNVGAGGRGLPLYSALSVVAWWVVVRRRGRGAIATNC